MKTQRELTTAPSASRNVAVEVADLYKEFPAPDGTVLRAVDGISFEVFRGEVFGFLGPNGAGKTTTLEIIEGLQTPTSGTTRVLGLDSQHERTRMKEVIGVQLQAAAYFDYLTLEEILDLFGSFYPHSLDPGPLLEKVGLHDKRRALVRELSGGQAQRFSIVAAMVNDPDVLFLDEPTAGLDPQARRNLWDLVTHINKKEGKTVVLTTHYMEEAQVLCDRIAIIDGGRIKALDTPMGLIKQLPDAFRIVFTAAGPLDESALRGLPGVTEVRPARNDAFRYELGVASSETTLPAFLDWARGEDIAVHDVQVAPATLEEVFLSLTGHSLRE